MQEKLPFKFFSPKDHMIAGIKFEPTSWKFMVIYSVMNWILTNLTWLAFMGFIASSVWAAKISSPMVSP